MRLSYLDLRTPHLFTRDNVAAPIVKPDHSSHATFAMEALGAADGDRMPCASKTGAASQCLCSWPTCGSVGRAGQGSWYIACASPNICGKLVPERGPCCQVIPRLAGEEPDTVTRRPVGKERRAVGGTAGSRWWTRPTWRSP